MGKHLHEVMNWHPVVTHRQLMTWDHFLREEWDRPTLECWYMMQIAAEVYNRERRKPVKVERFKLKFGKREPIHPSLVMTKEMVAKMNEITAKHQVGQLKVKGRR